MLNINSVPVSRTTRWDNYSVAVVFFVVSQRLLDEIRISMPAAMQSVVKRKGMPAITFKPMERLCSSAVCI